MNFHNLIRNEIQKYSVLQKIYPLSFSLIYTYICTPFIVSKILSQKSSILLIFLCYYPFYHPSLRCKSSELKEYFPRPSSNCILIVCVSISFYLRFCLSQSSILLIILCNSQFYHTYVR